MNPTIAQTQTFAYSGGFDDDGVVFSAGRANIVGIGEASNAPLPAMPTGVSPGLCILFFFFNPR
jgi:hypothetical protein